MDINQSEALIYGVFLCCILTVVGGLTFLMIGALKIKKRQKSPNGNVLSIEFRGLKLSTDAPAIGITICGLFFAMLAAWMDQNGTMIVRVTGHLEGADVQNVRLFAAYPLQQVKHPGNGSLHDDVAFVMGQDSIYIIPVVPGHPGPTMKEFEQPVGLLDRVRRVNVGDLAVTAPPIEMPEPSATRVTAPAPEPGSEKLKGY